MSTLHIHFTYAEDSGEIRRIKNINSVLAQNLSDKVIEVAFISIANFIKYKENKFKLNPSVQKKYYFPNLPLSQSNHFFKRLNSYWSSFIIFILWLLYQPKFAIAEFSIGWQVLRFLPRSVKCIIDVHGATREEYEYSATTPNKQLAETYDYFERKGMSNASYIVCQSDAMKKYLLKKYNFLTENKIFTYKCGADNKLFFIDKAMRSKMREELGIKDTETLFVYSGGIHKWQKIEDSMATFVEYSKVGDAKFLILTLNKEKAQALIDKQYGSLKNRFIVHSTTNSEVYKYLNAADIAFLLRDNVVLNQVASPTKLAEYMFCGLPIISSDVSQMWVENTSFIFNIDKNDIKEIDNFIKNVDKEAIAEYAQEFLSLECDKKNISRLIDETRK